MNPAQKALWYIEGHLGRSLTLDDIAAVAELMLRSAIGVDDVRASAAAES